MAHVLALGLWGGVVLAESVVEVVGVRGAREAETAARMHYWIDLCCELPILIAVVATGTALAASAHLTTLHLVKIALGLGAVAINLWCVGVVIRRHRRHQDDRRDDAKRETKRVFLAIKLGVPLAVGALLLGLHLA